MNTKMFVAILAMAFVPTAVAHFPTGTPNTNCNATENPHDYVSQASVLIVGAVSVFDGCPSATSDGDFEWGNGGAFLPASHHGNSPCVVDEVFGNVTFTVGADVDGDFVISNNAPDWAVTGSGCVTGAGGPGADGGYWVFIQGPASVGHVTA